MPPELNDIKHLRIIAIITTILSFANLNILFGNGHQKERRICVFLKRVYAIALLCAIPIYDSFQLYLKHTIFHRLSPLIVIDILARVTLTSFSLITIFLFSFYRCREFAIFLRTILRIDRIFAKYADLKHKNRYLWAELVLIHLYFCWAYLLEEYIYYLANKREYHHGFTGEHVEKYFIAVFILLARNLMKAIQERVICMNSAIENSVTSYRNKPCYTVGGANSEISDLRVMQGVLEKLCESMDNFNLVFEWPIMLFAQYTLITVLLSFSHVVRWYIHPPSKYLLKNRNFAWIYMFSNAVWSVYSMFIGALLVTSANSSSSEIIRTPRLCYKLIQDLNTSDRSQKQFFKKQLLLLSSRASKSKFHFKAAGFFKLNNSILFAFMHVLTTYLIFIIQVEK